MALMVCELFTSLAGETSRAGLPCTFIRLSGCNLNCSWCDTPYARGDAGRTMTVKEALDRILETGVKLVCVTGGEPLLQEDTFTLVRRLLRAGRRVLVETNGSLRIEDIPPRAHRIVDVKTPGSGEAKSFLLDNLAHLRGRDEVKFVIADMRDFDWAVRFAKKHDLAERCGLLVSPAWTPGSKRSAFRLLKQTLAKRVLTKGIPFRYNIQLHKVIWDAGRRGV